VEFRQLKYFIAIVEAGSFSKAAIHANVVQSALSQQIAALETELAASLLVRSAHGVSPTMAGELFYQHAQHLLRQVEHAKSVIRRCDNQPNGPVSIGIPTSTAATLSVPLIEACLARYPSIQLHIMEGLSRQIHQALNNATVDMAVQFSGQSMHGFKARRLLTEELFVVTGTGGIKPDRRIETINLNALREMRLMLPERGNGLRDLVEKLLESIGISANPLIELGSLTTIIEATEKGIGATILPWGAFQREHAAGRLHAYRLEGLSIPRSLMLCVSGTLPMSSAAQTFHDLVIEVVNQLVRQGTWKEVNLQTAGMPQQH
jgi:LysR family nitrogen assimilation transcriptional regulator